MENLSAEPQSFGNWSLSCRPGMLVEAGLYLPRISRGASGYMSYMSI